MKGLIAFYVESEKLEKDLEKIVKKHNLVLVPMLSSLVDKNFERQIREQIKKNLEKEFQCNRYCSPDWELFWKRLKK
jgi:hypothetical protein